MDPHTEAKHVILRKYLDAWLPIISRFNGEVLIIDGFAGPGEYVGGKEGSPIIALKAVLEHKLGPFMKAKFRFIFVEENTARCEHLKKVIASLPLAGNPNIQVEVACGRFDVIISQLLDDFDAKKIKLPPTFAFIDPFGFSGIPLSLITRIMRNKSCEVLVNFMYEEIVRFMEISQNGKHYDDLFGTDQWRLIHQNKALTPAQRAAQIPSLYHAQLSNIAGIQYVRTFKMINEHNKLDYFLFFGTNSPFGLLKMKEAMWRVDPTGTFVFSDATYNPEQGVLFDLTPDYARLKKEIVLRYKGKRIPITVLEDFVTTDTVFLPTHIRKHVLTEMENTVPPEIKVFRAGKTRKGSFPEGTVIEFL
jgi:three-Cys-motif partner protein